jgi:hypothetical protein
MSQRDNRISRRELIRSMVGGSLLFPAIVQQLLADDARGSTPDNPLAPRAPHFPGKARRVIFIYLTGGVSHIDTFDPKPRLVAEHGQRRILRPQWAFRRYGRCGTEVSDLFPHVGGCVDDICLIRSMTSEHTDHAQCTLGIHTGSVSVVRPSLGSWVSYGLGTQNQNLPSFVVLAPHLPYAGTQVWSSDFLPACHQGTRVVAGDEPIPNLNRRSPSQRVQELELGLLDRFNRMHQQRRQADPVLAARLRSFETAFGMQQAMPEVLDLRGEGDSTLRLYGLERGSTRGFAWQALVARRLAERGVRFIELIDTGSSNNWDSHGEMREHEPLARNVDRPIAALIKDLKQRGMLDETLIVCTTEFGRTPEQDGPNGRNHHSRAYWSWLAGGGVRGGMVYGKTDEYAREVVENPVRLFDFHATILHLLGFDHERLTFRHAGRDFRLTDVHGNVIHEILA